MASLRRNLFLASIYVDVVSVVLCFAVFVPISYPMALVNTEPYKTIYFLSYNPLMQAVCGITVIYAVILMVYCHYSERPSGYGELGYMDSGGQND